MELRHELKTTSDLGEYGAAAIVRALRAEGAVTPGERTIHRILARHGVFDAARRIRRPAPPPGWYLPACAAGDAELDSWDFVAGLVIAQGPEVEVLTVIALQSGVPGAWPGLPYTAVRTLDTILEHWHAVGVPDSAQFDNDTRFQGAHQHRDVISRVMRVCLQLQVVPVLAPPREHGFQNRLENFNGRWQSKVWARFHHDSLETLQQCSARAITAARGQVSVRTEAAPPRRSVPPGFLPDLQAPPQGRIVFLRRTTDTGTVSLLQHTCLVDPAWPHRLVRCEVDRDAHCIRFYRLRRRDPTAQPLVREVAHHMPLRRFKE